MALLKKIKKAAKKVTRSAKSAAIADVLVTGGLATTARVAKKVAPKVAKKVVASAKTNGIAGAILTGGVSTTVHTLKSRSVRAVGRKVDDAVGGAKGWSTVTATVGAAAQAIPGVGTVVGGALLATSAGLKVAAAKQAADKQARQVKAARVAAQRSAEAAMVEEAYSPGVFGPAYDAATGEPVPPGVRVFRFLFPR